MRRALRGRVRLRSRAAVPGDAVGACRMTSGRARVECPECGGMHAMVKNSNLDVEGNRIRQRRCDDCGHWFSTVEVVLPGLSFHKTRPSQRNGRRSPQYVRVVRTGDTSVRVELEDVKLLNVCRRGHPMTPDNVYVQPGRGNRSCMTCRR